MSGPVRSLLVWAATTLGILLLAAVGLVWAVLGPVCELIGKAEA